MKKLQFLLPLLLLPALVFGGVDSWKVGDVLPAFELKDQHDKVKKLDDQVRLILFAKEMATKGIINEMLNGEGEGFLEEHQTIYIADISGMPGFATRWFALPKMRKYGYSLLLDYTGEVTGPIPTRKKKVTLIYLDKKKVINIQHLDRAELLKQEIVRDALP